MAAEQAVERLTNLAFALQGAAATGSPARDSAWIRKNVAGYQDRGDEAFHKQLSRDILTLQRAGVPIIHNGGQEGATYRLDPQEYQLPEVSFTAEEAMVLGVAGGIGTAGGLGEYSLSGWTKLAAAGAQRDLELAPAYTASNDLTEIAPEVATAILTAVRAGLRIRFDYRPTPDAEPARRTMDPWGLVNHSSRVYLVGYDVDRAAPRTFRLRKLSNVRRAREDATHLQPTQPLDEVVRATLRHGDVVTATVRVDGEYPRELLAQAEEISPGLYRLADVDRDWLVRTAVGYAADVEVTEPAEVRRDIGKLLCLAAESTATGTTEGENHG